MQRELSGKVLVLRPETDRAANTLSKWADALLSRNYSQSFLDLKGFYATRTELNALAEASCAFVFFCHGNHDRLLGNTEALLDTDNVILTANRITIAIACHAARTLGPATVEAGAVAFLGFNDRLVWSPDFQGDFGTAAISGIEQMLTGVHIARAAEVMREHFAQLVTMLKKSRHPNAGVGWLSAFWNQQHVEWKGDGSATLPKVIAISVRAP